MRHHSSRGFTLVELLVVISIIAILAAAISVAIGPAIFAANKERALVMMQQVQAAISNYDTEYGVYPTDAALAGAATDAYYPLDNGGMPKWADLTIALAGNLNVYTGVAAAGMVPNTRSIAYLTPRKGDVDKAGALKSPFSTVAAPSYFALVMDTNYDGILGNGASGVLLPDFAGAAGLTVVAGNTVVTGGAALWCNCDQPVGSLAVKTVVSHWAHTY